MSFNIDGSSGNIITRAPQLVKLIKDKDPDVIFIAEYPEENIKVLDTLLNKFSYSTCTKGYAHYFYSKYLLEKQERLHDGIMTVGAHKSSIVLHGDTIRLYGCHFASNNYTSKRKYITPDSINSKENAITYIKDIELAYYQRAHEARILVEDLKSCYYPVMIMGDFNDVGGSMAVRILEDAGFKDAWWKGGYGYGATIHKPLPFRIDHIMYSKELKLRKIEVVSSDGLSDHDALYAEFVFTSGKKS